MLVNVHRSLYDISFVISRFKCNVISRYRFSKNTQLPNLAKIRRAVAELFHVDRQTCERADGRTDRQTDKQTDRQAHIQKNRHMIKPIVSFRNFATSA